MRFRCALFSLSVVCLSACSTAPGKATLNDVHSQLNRTSVRAIHAPTTVQEISQIVREAGARGRKISIAGGRHAMGGQQFGKDSIHLDIRSFNRIVELDARRGILTVQAGAMWPEILEYLARAPGRPWSFRQKQTGADRLTVGGALSSNVHGRGLLLPPFIGDVESFGLVLPDGREIKCSRSEHRELFRLVIGGYGLFGVITEVKLRLMPRQKLERVVRIVPRKNLTAEFQQAIRQGFRYGDWQYHTDEKDPRFLSLGVFSLYRPSPSKEPVPATRRVLRPEDWARLYELAFRDEQRAWQEYSRYYLSTNGQLYWSDESQMSTYLETASKDVKKWSGSNAPSSLMISELYVPRPRLQAFLADAAAIIKAHDANVVYGTIRLIARDPESFLAWAKQDYACTIVNLHVVHTAEGIAKAERVFQALIDAALNRDGSYYLTYHRWARKDQVLRAYPQFVAFLRKKKQYDPGELFETEWYRHYRNMFAAELQQAGPRF